MCAALANSAAANASESKVQLTREMLLKPGGVGFRLPAKILHCEAVETAKLANGSIDMKTAFDCPKCGTVHAKRIDKWWRSCLKKSCRAEFMICSDCCITYGFHDWATGQGYPCPLCVLTFPVCALPKPTYDWYEPTFEDDLALFDDEESGEDAIVSSSSSDDDSDHEDIW